MKVNVISDDSQSIKNIIPTHKANPNRLNHALYTCKNAIALKIIFIIWK